MHVNFGSVYYLTVRFVVLDYLVIFFVAQMINANEQNLLSCVGLMFCETVIL